MVGFYFEEFWVIRIILDIYFIQDIVVLIFLESILVKKIRYIEINLEIGLVNLKIKYVICIVRCLDNVSSSF